MIRRVGYLLKLKLLGLVRIRRNYRDFQIQALKSENSSEFRIGKRISIYTDFRDFAGVASGHYFHQDLYFAREIYLAKPPHHFDVGSRIDGFVSHLATFREVNVFDIRPLNVQIPGINFLQLDIMDTQSVLAFPKISSLSCLHTLEHFGLGRYGDTINYDGWQLGLQNLSNLLLPRGRFYLSVPIGKVQRIEFNAHRIFNPKFLTQHLMQDFYIEKTAAVRDNGQLDLNADFTDEEFLSEFDDEYGCGLFVLTKR